MKVQTDQHLPKPKQTKYTCIYYYKEFSLLTTILFNTLGGSEGAIREGTTAYLHVIWKIHVALNKTV